MISPQELIRHVSQGKPLTLEQAAVAMEGIMTGEWTPAQIGSYITALHMKGETKDEIVGSAYVMRSKAFHLEVRQRPLIDIVGSGGDGLRTINVSTLAGLVCAGAGLHIAKHGNRAMTGQCGSADILEGLGVQIDISPADAIRGVDENGFAFLMAPHFHQSMKHAVGPRREIGIPTIFNHLGPLTNPVGPEYQLIGVNHRDNTRRFTDVLVGLGCQRSIVVHGADGMDEITLTGETYLVEQRAGKVQERTLVPEDFGMQRVPITELSLADKETAVHLAHDFLRGEAPRQHEDLVLLNAAAALYLCDKAANIADGVALARETLHSGAALHVLQKVVAYTNSRKLS
ncbi:MAG: anthranilate phosphoribosyltransferase [Candidatus Lambdaproteobacteria bacterium]|nr:anthranilate phosphoribosyltransferase [Candidatus Lambdaproteobacteria bacterium]